MKEAKNMFRTPCEEQMTAWAQNANIIEIYRFPPKKRESGLQLLFVSLNSSQKRKNSIKHSDICDYF